MRRGEMDWHPEILEISGYSNENMRMRPKVQ